MQEGLKTDAINGFQLSHVGNVLIKSLFHTCVRGGAEQGFSALPLFWESQYMAREYSLLLRWRHQMVVPVSELSISWDDKTINDPGMGFI